MNNSQPRIAYLLLRLGMAAVYLYFGFSQVFAPSDWVGVVPSWATSLSGMTPQTIVLANGVMEVVLATLLALSIWVRWVSLILALHLFIISLGFGISATGIRDLGLTIATLSLAFFSGNRSLERSVV